MQPAKLPQNFNTLRRVGPAFGPCFLSSAIQAQQFLGASASKGDAARRASYSRSEPAAYHLKRNETSRPAIAVWLVRRSIASLQRLHLSADRVSSCHPASRSSKIKLCFHTFMNGHPFDASLGDTAFNNSIVSRPAIARPDGCPLGIHISQPRFHQNQHQAPAHR